MQHKPDANGFCIMLQTLHNVMNEHGGTLSLAESVPRFL